MLQPLELRPRTGTEVVDAAFQLLRRHYVAMATAAAVVFSPVMVLRLLLPETMGGLADLLFNLVASVADAAIIVLVADAYLGRRVDVGAALRAVVARGGSVLGASLLRGVLVMLGLVLLVVPGLIALAVTFAMPMAVMLEDEDVGGALHRSRALVRGHAWRVFGTLVVTQLLYVLLLAALGAVLGLLLPVFALPERILTVLVEVATIAFYPPIAVVATLLYFDLRIRKEAFDLEMMSAGLDPAPPPAAAGAVAGGA